jgi:hypothetical protein
MKDHSRETNQCQVHAAEHILPKITVIIKYKLIAARITPGNEMKMSEEK